MKRIISVFCGSIALFILSCASAPEEIASPAPVPGVPPAEAEAEAEIEFDPSSITQEEFDTTISDVRQFISDLNTLVRNRDYDGWAANLGPSYYNQINSPEFLNRISQSSERLKRSNITLANARDYFMQVVVPSRTNDRVDDIEFITRSRVKAYTINAQGQRLRLYDLENTGRGWRIIN